ncbi:protein rolling stone-like [Glandiceps talaboti]
MSSLLAPVVTILYWGALHAPGTGVSYLDFQIHAMNSIAIALEFALAATPIRYLHVVYAGIFGVFYVIISVIFWATGGTNFYDGGNYVYPILDYGEKPWIAVATITVSIVIGMVFQLLYWGIYKLKIKISRRNRGRELSLNIAMDGIANPASTGIEEVK